MSGYKYYKPSEAVDDGGSKSVTHYKLGGMVADTSSEYNTMNYGSNSSSSSRNYQQTEKYYYKDQDSGRYTNATVRNEASTGQLFKERGSSGRVGYRDEVKQTSTYRVGDNTGYTEYQYQERVRQVKFNKSINNK